MKFKPVAAFIFLILVTTVPDQSKAVSPAWFAAIALKLSVKLAKNSWYARCNTRYVPAGIDCPVVVFGVGLSYLQAQADARFYAKTFGDPGCDAYVGHCQIHKFVKKWK